MSNYEWGVLKHITASNGVYTYTSITLIYQQFLFNKTVLSVCRRNGGNLIEPGRKLKTMYNLGL